jgi:hypothetical protein
VHVSAGRFQCADLREICDAQDEADGVQDVGLAAPVEAGDGVESCVEVRHHGTRGVRLKAVNDYLLNVHDLQTERTG